MAQPRMRCFTVGLALAVGSCACAQEVGSPALASARIATPESSTTAPGGPTEDEWQSDSEPDEPLNLLDRLCRTVSHQEDPYGPINTDRPMQAGQSPRRK
jgi:hypothetical protein